MPFLQNNGSNLYYESNGKNGEPILFIQGIGAAGSAWKPQVEELSLKHQTLISDNRGFGQSKIDKNAEVSIEAMVDDSRALIDAMGWDSCHVIGHSMGGVIAQRFALSHPRRVRTLGLLCTVSRGADAVRMSPKTLIMGMRTRIGPYSSRRRAFLELIYPLEYLASVDRASLAADLAPLFGRDLADNPPILMKQAMALRKHDCTNELARLADIPTMVLSATHDPIAPPRFGEAMAKAIPGAYFIEIEKASHGVPIHLASTVNKYIENHLTRRVK